MAKTGRLKLLIPPYVMIIFLCSLTYSAWGKTGGGWKPQYQKKPAPVAKAPPVAPSAPSKTEMGPLAHKFFKASSKEDLKKIGQEVMAQGPKAVPELVSVMKNGSFPMESRWVATLLLARTMGKKSSSFIAKFIEHPHYMLRMASLKALLGLQEKEKLDVYRKALKDPSLMVRVQALDNISGLGLNQMGGDVWQVLLDKQNYQTEMGKMRRSLVIKKAIRTLGDIKFQPALATLSKLIQKPNYQDVFPELEYGLEQLTGKKAPEGDIANKRKFWASAITI